VPLDAALELPVFSGPLDLLLDLVERRKLEITTVSLATVATQYLEAVRALPEPDPDVLGEFLR
jgi:segregation and condensation protein A